MLVWVGGEEGQVWRGEVVSVIVDIRVISPPLTNQVVVVKFRKAVVTLRAGGSGVSLSVWIMSKVGVNPLIISSIVSKITVGSPSSSVTSLGITVFS